VNGTNKKKNTRKKVEKQVKISVLEALTKMEYKLPRGIPKEIRELLIRIFSYAYEVLKDKLIGIYLHGSLATSSFQLGSSDIDLMFIVKQKLSFEEKSEIINQFNKFRSEGKPIDMSIFLEDVIQNPQYPILVELHYDYPDNIFQDEQDREVVAHLYETKEIGFCVWGKPIREVFSRIPARHYLLSIFSDLKHTRRYLLESPIYWVLNACRTMAFIRRGEVLSKVEGGKWALKRLPRKYRNLINQAMLCYLRKVNKEQVSWDGEELEEFADYVTDEIRNTVADLL